MSSINIRKLPEFLIKHIILFILTTYILIFFLNPLLVKHTTTASYQYASYDVVLVGAMHSYINDLKDNVKSYIEVSTFWLDFKLKSKEDFINTNLYAINSSSLDSVIDIIIPKSLFIKYDKKLFMKQNSIIITRELAQALNVNCGDIINNIVYGDYYVAGIFENAIKNSYSIDGIILENRDEIIKSNKDFPLTLSYIEFIDKEKGIDYIKNTYYNQGRAYEMYGENWTVLIKPEDKENFKSASYKIRTISLENQMDKLNYNSIESIVHVTIGLFLIIIIQIYSNHKLIKMNLKKIAILRIAGYTYNKMFRYYFINSFSSQAFIVLTSLYFCKTYGWTYHYLSKAIIITWIPIFIICIFLSALIIGIFSIYETNPSKLIQILQSEE